MGVVGRRRRRERVEARPREHTEPPVTVPRNFGLRNALVSERLSTLGTLSVWSAESGEQNRADFERDDSEARVCFAEMTVRGYFLKLERWGMAVTRSYSPCRIGLNGQTRRTPTSNSPNKSFHQ